MITTNFNYDNAAEQKQGEATFNSQDCQPVQREIRIRLGYTQTDSAVYIINCADDLRIAIADALALCEGGRLRGLGKIQADNALTPAEVAFKNSEIATGKRFRQINFPGATQEKLSAWGRAEREKRNRPALNIFLSRNGDRENVYLHSTNYATTLCWRWYGIRDFQNLDVAELYRCALETTEHCEQIDQFIESIV